MNRTIIYSTIVVLIIFLSCNKKKSEPIVIRNTVTFQPTPYPLNLPEGFPQMPLPADNPLTVEGVELGRKLFFEKRLSGDNSMSCASCHLQAFGFTDDDQFSIGIDGLAGNRNSMVIQNLAWSPKLFWDGRANSLEQQALGPVPNPIEMHQKWTDAAKKLTSDSEYKNLFYKAFGSVAIDSTTATKALAQYMRTLISGNSKFDQWLRGEVTLTAEEQEGFNLFNALDGGDCFHCHPVNPFFTDFSFRNNGLDENPSDKGHGKVTGNATDDFKFKVPTLRNLAYSAPYMHDGRFQTLDEVIDFYSEGLQHNSPNIDPLMEFSSQGGVLLTPSEKAALKAFLLTLSDPDFIANPEFQDPN
ncbi:MAG: cytochrome-c peroxidase [Bacteroidia bacterium]